jgi:hypothetical protein
MSIALYSAQQSVLAVGSHAVLSAGNYAITDIYATVMNIVPTAIGGINFQADLVAGGLSFCNLSYLNNGAAAGTPMLQCPVAIRSFSGDPLILPRGSTITIVTTIAGNLTSINLSLNLSGFVLP